MKSSCHFLFSYPKTLELNWKLSWTLNYIALHWPTCRVDPVWTPPPTTQIKKKKLSQSKSYFTTGGLPPVSSFWLRAPWDSRPDFFSQLNTCCHSPYITSPLTRGWVCHLELLLSLARAFILWSKVQWDSRPYFTVSDSRLPFLSPPTTRRATV
jgi:hypothetical protein